MTKKLYPDLGFNADAKQVLVGLLKKTLDLIRNEYICEPVDIGILAAHLRDFCCFCDNTDSTATTGFFGGFDGNTSWPGLCEKLQETADLEWHLFLEDHLSSGEWPEKQYIIKQDPEPSAEQENDSTISMETKLA
jgi:hypothetical protein